MYYCYFDTLTYCTGPVFNDMYLSHFQPFSLWITILLTTNYQSWFACQCNLSCFFTVFLYILIKFYNTPTLALVFNFNRNVTNTLRKGLIFTEAMNAFKQTSNSCQSSSWIPRAIRIRHVCKTSSAPSSCIIIRRSKWISRHDLNVKWTILRTPRSGVYSTEQLSVAYSSKNQKVMRIFSQFSISVQHFLFRKCESVSKAGIFWPFYLVSNIYLFIICAYLYSVFFGLTYHMHALKRCNSESSM